MWSVDIYIDVCLCALNDDYLNWIINLFVCVSEASGSSCLELSRWVYTTNSTKIKLWICWLHSQNTRIGDSYYIYNIVVSHRMLLCRRCTSTWPSNDIVLVCVYVCCLTRSPSFETSIEEFGTIEWTDCVWMHKQVAHKNLRKINDTKVIRNFWTTVNGFVKFSMQNCTPW